MLCGTCHVKNLYESQTKYTCQNNRLVDYGQGHECFSEAMSYPQQLPVSPVHMLEAVVCCVAPTVPTLPVPLLKCLTFHPPPLCLMTGCVWED